MKLAFQGELGAFSHLAATEFFPKSEIKTCQTFEECFRLATENSEYKIIIPIELENICLHNCPINIHQFKRNYQL